MTAAHMGMVFAAQGLDGSEKLLLLAYTNRTDDHGYCWPGQKRLADDCGTSPATVKRAKASLVKKGLIASVRRVHPVTGDPITNLTRVNLELLAAMARPTTVYDDNVVEQLTFAPIEQPPRPTKQRKTKPKTTTELLKAQNEPDPHLLMDQSEPIPGSDCARPGFNLNPPRGQDEPLNLSDHSENSHLSTAPAAALVTPLSAEADTNERGTSASPDKPTPPAVAAVVADAFAEQWKTKNGTSPGRRQLQAVAADAADAVEDGDEAEWLLKFVVPFMVRNNYLDLGRAKTHPQCPAPLGTKVPSQSSGVPNWCGECNDGIRPELVAERFRKVGGRLTKCGACHPGAIKQTAAV